MLLPPSVHCTTNLTHPPTMDLPNPLPVTLDADARINGETSDDSNDSSGWPLVRPAREALDYLEHALTTGIPKPTYDGPIRQPIMHGGRHPIDMVFTLPLETPFDTAQPTLPLVRMTLSPLPPSPPPPPFLVSSTRNLRLMKSIPAPHVGRHKFQSRARPQNLHTQ